MNNLVLLTILVFSFTVNPVQASDCQNLNGDIIARKYADGEFLIGTPADGGMYVGILHSRAVKIKIKAQIGFDLWVKKTGKQVITGKDQNGFETNSSLDIFTPAPECAKEATSTKSSGSFERKKNAASCPEGTKFISSQDAGATWTEEYCSLGDDGTGVNIKHGKFTTWYEGNRKGEEGSFDHNKKVGIWRQFEIAGRSKGYVGCETTYSSPDLKKLLKCYFPNGKVKETQTFTDDGQEAVYTLYNQKGQTVEINDKINNKYQRLIE